MKVRIGIDVGGTFTDAVAINNDTYELIGTVKVPTTHTAKEGVAAGIVEVLHKVMEENGIRPEDVTFIAHGTTQATNALLEGDVANVGIVTMGSGLQGAKSRSDTAMGSIELAAGKFLPSENVYVDTGAAQDVAAAVKSAVQELIGQGATSIVAAEAFSVDDPANENAAVHVCAELGVPGTATNDISKLYGLKIRTRTAVVNASIMPKMLEAATMTERSIQGAGIKSPLMVMRCDGGVMTVEEVRNRPILTILSGPAAGVAGSLMYEKLRDGKAVGTGPRSAHIADLEYEVYSKPEDIVEPRLTGVRPTPTDPEYACIQCTNGVKVALTMAGAANIAGYVHPDDYAYGSREAAEKAWKPLADNMGCTVEEAAKRVLAFAAEKNARVASQLMKDYQMDPRNTVFVGGGGGASTVVPHLAETMGHKHRIAKNAPVISTIGVALAMVRDMVERTVTNPTDDDIISVRREAELKAIQNGAAPGTVEVSVEVDTQRNIIRAIAVGATEMRSKDMMNQKLGKDALFAIVAENLGADKAQLRIVAENGPMFAVQYDKVEKKLFGLRKKTTHPLRLIDEEGVIRLQKNNAWVRQSSVAEWEKDAAWMLEELTEYNDGGANLPNLYVVLGKRVIDLSGLSSDTQIYSLGNVELAGCGAQEPLIVAATKRVDA